MLFFLEKSYVFTILQKVAEVREYVYTCVLINYIGKGYFLTGHSEKGYRFQIVGHTV